MLVLLFTAGVMAGVAVATTSSAEFPELVDALGAAFARRVRAAASMMICFRAFGMSLPKKTGYRSLIGWKSISRRLRRLGSCKGLFHGGSILLDKHRCGYHGIAQVEMVLGQ
jgi:hypothetical protein